MNEKLEAQLKKQLADWGKERSVFVERIKELEEQLTEDTALIRKLQEVIEDLCLICRVLQDYARLNTALIEADKRLEQKEKGDE